jgi:DNA-binding transcriptional MerR regulator
MSIADPGHRDHEVQRHATYTVGQVARIAHVSVRTLHHYDELGVLHPFHRSEAGYRLYTSADLERLQEVLFYEEIGFGLDEIRELMAGPVHDRGSVLREQRDKLAARALRLEAMLSLIERTLASLEGRTEMTDEELFEVFGDFDPSEHEDEARERWGDGDAYRESARRTRDYTKEDWQLYKRESDAIVEDLAALMDQAVPPEDVRATEAAERHRMQIDRWFYPCSREMHVELGRMYVGDPRFATTYDKVRPGMAQYLCDAIAANAGPAGPPGLATLSAGYRPTRVAGRDDAGGDRPGDDASSADHGVLADGDTR